MTWIFDVFFYSLQFYTLWYARAIDVLKFEVLVFFPNLLQSGKLSLCIFSVLCTILNYTYFFCNGSTVVSIYSFCLSCCISKNLQKVCSWSKKILWYFWGLIYVFIWNHLKMMHWLKLYKSNWTFNSQPQAVLFWKLFHILLCLWKIHSLPLYYC